MSEIISMSDGVLTRSDGILENVDFKHRIIDVIAVPWEKEAQVFWRGEFWTEVFQRGAFDRLATAKAPTIRVNREHRKGVTVGRIDGFEPQHTKGLFSRIKVVRGAAGDELLYLAEDDMISASIGYRANNIGVDVLLDKIAKTRRVVGAFLDHLGMVEDPAYKDAEVLAVRGGGAPGKPADEPLPATPVLDEFLRDPVLIWARDRVAASTRTP